MVLKVDNKSHRGKQGKARGGVAGIMQNVQMYGGDDEDMMGAFGGGSGGQGGSNGNGLSDKVFESIKSIEADSSKIACECNHGLMVEAMKRYMFSAKTGGCEAK